MVLHRVDTSVAFADCLENVRHTSDPTFDARYEVIATHGKDKMSWAEYYGAKATACSMPVDSDSSNFIILETFAFISAGSVGTQSAV